MTNFWLPEKPNGGDNLVWWCCYHMDLMAKVFNLIFRWPNYFEWIQVLNLPLLFFPIFFNEFFHSSRVIDFFLSLLQFISPIFLQQIFFIQFVWFLSFFIAIQNHIFFFHFFFFFAQHFFQNAGPEHSSARLERFLQLSDDDPNKIYPAEEGQRKQIQETNFQVANITTPANYFHALRRQVKKIFGEKKNLEKIWMLRFRLLAGTSRFSQTLDCDVTQEFVASSNCKISVDRFRWHR